MKYYVSTYALSTGILEVEGDVKDNMLTYKNQYGFITYVPKPNWHDNIDDAVYKANEMRTKKILSMNKKIKELHSIDFYNNINPVS